MTIYGWLQIAIYFLILLALTKPMGRYLFRVLEGAEPPLGKTLGKVESLLYRLMGVDPRREQTWKEYTVAMLLFSVVTMLITYAILRLQAVWPLNPQNFAAVGPELSFNTAASFTTNTNWQAYGGESTMSYFSQMAGLAWHNFISAAVGIAIAVALARGLTRRRTPDAAKTIGNFWTDLTRATLYVLLPICIVVALFLVSQGVIQNFDAYQAVTSLDGGQQTIAMGPVASQEAIKMLGTNGGGFFNANSAHPFENPTPFTNFIQMLLIFVIPAGLTYMFGKMARDTKQGWAIFAAMSVLFLVGVGVAYYAEAQANPALNGMGIHQLAGNMEGKEVRYGVGASSLFAVITTGASCGAVNAMHDSFNALGGMIPMVNMLLGEVVFGGVGAGLYGMLIYVLLAVFIAGLMVGRTPEYLGKKIEAKEMKLLMLYILIFPLVILGFSAWAAVVPYGVSSLNNAGPHGLSEIIYAFTSATGNNGSAFAGLNANTPFWNITLGLAMLAGRFLMMIPALAIAGSMVGKKTLPPSLGTFPTNGWLFVGLLASLVLILGGLTFFPAVALGPVADHFAAMAGQLF